MSGMTFSSTEKVSFLSDCILISQDLLSDILFSINQLNNFVPQNEYYINRSLINLTNDISKFVELTSLLTKLLQTSIKQTVPEIKESHLQLLFILKGINQARINQDFIALEELIKYELKDNLTQWKIDLIPQVKRLLAP
ncbi:MAG: hypothetical protein AB7I27_05125 [Bacteriovoracaceae bacterium]